MNNKYPIETEKNLTSNEKTSLDSKNDYLKNAIDITKSITSSLPSNITPLYPGKKLIDSISSSMDKLAGNDTTTLILKTMKLIFHVEEKDFVKNPQIFATALSKIIGGTASNRLQGSILQELKQQILSID
jgi:hypothetical protein